MDSLISSDVGLYYLGLISKVALVGTLVILAFRAIQVLTKRSPYEYISGPKPSSILGYLFDLHDPDNLDFHFKMTERYGHVARLKAGIFGSDGLYISDPLALHSILVRDQNIFEESTEFSGLFGVIHHGDQLGSVQGEEHKKQKKLMNPAFTAANVSKLSPLFYKIATELRDKLIAEIGSSPVYTLDILDRLSQAALELISQGGIGHTFDSFEGSKEFHEFHEALKNVLPTASRLFLILPFFESWRKKKPVWLRRAIASLAYIIPWPALRAFKAAVDTLHPVCAKAFYEKKAIFDEGGMGALAKTASGGRDLTTLLIQANAEADEQDRLPDEIVIANMSGFMLGGQETTSGAMSRLLDIMTLQPELQVWLREEITEALVKKNGEHLDFYELNALPRLDAICRETLRLFGPVTFVWRQTLKDTVVPLQFPVMNTKTVNRSTAIWGPDGDEFKPERWIGHQAHAITVEKIKTPGIYSNMLTFLGGGRGCPGMKFALLEIKTVLSVLLHTFHFEKTDDIIDWRLGLTFSPYIRGKVAEGPQVPMKISLLNAKK